MTVLVDYGAGNLTSVKNAFLSLGVETHVTRDPADLGSADRVVFPGVGAAGRAMANLRELRLLEPLRAFARSGRPFLGICLGMQILFEHSEEDGGVETLGLLPGCVRMFPRRAGFKVPEIGWNQVRMAKAACGVKDGSEFYFVHSYYAEKGPYTAGESEYADVTFTAMVKRENIVACQFHPEKSGRLGLALLKEWLAC